MRKFKASGLWFLGDDSKNRVAGTLRYSASGLHLKLMGSFRSGLGLLEEPYPLIHGVVNKNPYGEFVTLIDCFTKRQEMTSSGIGTETIFCHRGFAGDSYLHPDYDEFQNLTVKFSYLDEWFGREGIVSQIVHGEPLGLDVQYRKPEPARLSVGDQVLSLDMSWSSSESFRSLSIAEEAHLSIEPLPQLTAIAIQEHYVSPLRNLLSFATDTSNAVDDIRLTGEQVALGRVKWHRKYHVLANPIFWLKKSKNLVVPDHLLFTFDEAQETGLNIFERWFEFTRRHKAFCTIYFAFLDSPPRYLDEKFLALMTAFTLLSAAQGEVSERTSVFLNEIHTHSVTCFTPEERALLGPALPTGPEIEMPFRLLRLLEEHRPLMSQLLGDDLEGFVRNVVDTLAFVKRRQEANNKPPLQGSDLHYAMEKILILIKIVVLLDLGFDEVRVTRFVERNRHFIHIKHLRSLA